MDSRILSHNPDTGVTEWFHYDDTTDTFHIENKQDMAVFGEPNADQYNAVSTKSSTQWQGDLHKVASIPLVLYMDMVKTGMIHDQTAMRRWLDDPDNRVFRTKPGSL